jgi:hypothetical protein
MREYILRRGVNWQGALKQKGVKQMGVKEGLVVLSYRVWISTKR